MKLKLLFVRIKQYSCFVHVACFVYDSVAITNKMQLNNGIYYSTVHYNCGTVE